MSEDLSTGLVFGDPIRLDDYSNGYSQSLKSDEYAVTAAVVCVNAQHVLCNMLGTYYEETECLQELDGLSSVYGSQFPDFPTENGLYIILGLKCVTLHC